MIDVDNKPIVNRSNGDLFLDMRVRALYSPYYFIKSILGYDNLDPTFHLPELNLFVDAWAMGHRKQSVRWPRGWFKTTCFTIGMAIWITLPVRKEDTEYALKVLKIPEKDWFARVTLHDQNTTQLIAMEKIENAIKKINEIKWHFEENTLFRDLFPEIAYNGTEPVWNSECLIIRRTGYEQRVSEGTFEAIGVNGALQSRHYKIVWEDDLVGKKALESETVMTSTIRWHGLLNGAFKSVEVQTRFVIGNCWRLNDLNAHIAENEKDYIIHTRAAYEPNEHGELVSTAPNIASYEGICAVRDSGSMKYHDFCAQYLNAPRNPSDSELNTSNIHEYQVVNGMIKCECGITFHPKDTYRLMNYDPYNAKGIGSKSRPAIVAVGCGPEKHLVVFDFYNQRGEYGVIFKKLFEFATRWKITKMTYEDVGHQNMTEHHIKQLQNSTDFGKSNFSKIHQIIAVKSTKEKFQRIRDGLINSLEHVTLCIRPQHAVIKEMLKQFPNEVFDHDYDLLDALNQGVGVWKFPNETPEEVAEQIANSEKEMLDNLKKPFTYSRDADGYY